MIGARLSISARLTLWYGLSMVILLGVFAAYLYASFHVGLHRDFAATLRQEKTRAERTLAEEPALTRALSLTGAPVQDPPVRRFSVGAGTYVRVLSPEGRPVARSANFKDTEAFAAALPDPAGAQVQERVVARSLRGTRAQTLYAPIYEGAGSGTGGALRGWLEITRLESALHRELHRLAWLLGVGALLGIAVALGAGYGLSRRALRPVADLTQAARRIHRQSIGTRGVSTQEYNAYERDAVVTAQQDAGRRLPVPSGARDELTELADAFNDMLAALERSLAETQQSFEREKRFRADAAHELMTPVSSIQSEAEITLRRERTPAAYQQSLQAIQERAAHMSALVERLLTISRLEAGVPGAGVPGAGGLRAGASDPGGSSGAEPANLSVLACEAVRRSRRHADGKGLALEARIAPDLWVRAAEENLVAVLENLLSNALKYTPPGGTVRCVLRREDGPGTGLALLRVEDTGAGFEGSEEVLFERFRRSSSADVQDRPGTGLGLAIVRAVVRAYDGEVRAQSEGRGCGSVFEVALPLCVGSAP